MLHDQPDEALDVPSNEEELFGIAAQIGIWQSANALSDAKLLKKFPGLGSTKTYKKLLGRDDEQLNVGTWLPAYKGVLRIIEEETQERTSRVLPDLSHMISVSTPAMRLTMSTGNKRLMLIQGDTGAGKTTALKHVASQLPGSVVFVEADEAWDSKTAAAAALCLKVGVKIKGSTVRNEDDLPHNFAKLQSLLITTLQSRRIIAIDEGHHMSGKTLNMLKTLINKTNSVFIVAAMPTLWRKLQMLSWEEAKQLKLNRLFANVMLDGPTAEDAMKYFASHLKLMGDVKKAVASVAEASARFGCMAFLESVVDQCATYGAADEVDTATLMKAATDVKARCEGR